MLLKAGASLGCTLYYKGTPQGRDGKDDTGGKAGAHPQMRPLTVTGLRWVPRQQLTLAGVALGLRASPSAGLGSVLPFSLCCWEVSIQHDKRSQPGMEAAAAQNFLFR